ncbi:MAG: hypothetical protein H6942_16235 [Candidatus Accumulibacter sp.]|uniref:DUF6794 domain-containing protein n=1 Tax=Accumulibacter sp. TaxID=2053492 RepID=UPI0025FDC70E|nr:DUF6794 domain-containing protein [Accumulibacter sp.]MCP5250051.1 hypothetical protein [Accumulibacter sp.]
MAAMAQSEIVERYFVLSMSVRNDLGLWDGNDKAMPVIGKGDPPIHPDDASMLIIDAVWERLREMVPKRL